MSRPIHDGEEGLDDVDDDYYDEDYDRDMEEWLWDEY